MEQLTFEQAEAQIATLNQHIAAVRETQKQQAIVLIKDMVIANNITSADLVFIVDPVADKKPSKVRKDRAVKYRDEAGNEWVGIGKMPKWMQEKIASGATKEQFAI